MPLLHLLHVLHIPNTVISSLRMSFCRIVNRNQRNSNSQCYLNETASKLRRILQEWIRLLLISPWAYIKSLQDSIEENGLYFPLAIIEVNHEGI